MPSYYEKTYKKLQLDIENHKCEKNRIKIKVSNAFIVIARCCSFINF